MLTYPGSRACREGRAAHGRHVEHRIWMHLAYIMLTNQVVFVFLSLPSPFLHPVGLRAHDVRLGGVALRPAASKQDEQLMAHGPWHSIPPLKSLAAPRQRETKQ